ncbi:MAG: YihY/virulence factor BrkB family protein [Reinekea sp.]
MKATLYGITGKVSNFLKSETVTSGHIGQMASLLTLTTLFTLVPIASGTALFLAQIPSIQTQLSEQFELMMSSLVPEQALVWRTRAQDWVQDAGQLQPISIVMLLVSLFFLVNQVDRALHTVFQVEKGRSRRRWLHYLWVMPSLLVVVSMVMTLFILLQIFLGTGLLHLLPGLNNVSIPVLWLLLVIVYQLASRGHIKLGRNLIVSLGVTLAFYALKGIFAWLYISLPNWSLVYGIFSALPLFLLWCQMAWSVFLYGALVLRWLSW